VTPRRVIVLGAGAIGSAVGALLHESGTPTLLLARGPHGNALRRDGLDLRLPEQSRRLRTPTVATLAEAAATPNDLIILAVMGHHTAAAIEGLAPQVPVASFQNGTAPLDLLATRDHPLVAAMLYVPAERRGPGIVALSGAPNPGTILLGSWPPAPAPPCIPWLTERLCAVGFRAHAEADMGRWVRTKLLINLAGIIVALCDEPPTDVIEAAQAEARAVWSAASLPFEAPAALLERVGPLRALEVDGVPRIGGSTRHALQRGDPLETSSLHGPVVAEGARLGVPTPVNAALIRLAEAATAAGTMSAAGLRVAVGMG
jgi:2-dehydropantoate 2-reductase